MDLETFGKYIADRRRELGMTQKDLAERLDVTPKAVSRWERCVGYPDIESFQKLAAALDVSVDSLFAGKIRKEPLNDEAVVEIARTSVEIDRKNNRRQERIVDGLIACVSILTGVLFYLSGYGNVGASLLFGLLASGLVVSVCYLLAADRTSSKRIYTASAAIFTAILTGLLWFALR